MLLQSAPTIRATPAEDTTLNDTLVCTDANGNTLTYSRVTNAANGNVTVNGNGSFSYVPNANFTGSDSFTFKANDGTVDSNTATYSITVNAVNDAPTCANDAGSTSEDTTLNDTLVCTDADGNTLTYSRVDQCGQRQRDRQRNGSFSYVPNANFTGSDSFTFKANDGTVDSNTATYSITVTAVNDAPTCDSDSATIDEDTTLNSAVTCSDVDGDTLNHSLIDDVANGTLSFDADGTFSYTPDANFNGSDGFTFSASDGLASSGIASFSITVNAVNDAPTCEDVSITTDEDTLGSTAPDCSDVDGDTLTYAIVSQPADGSAAVNLGQLEYSPDLNFNGSDSLHLQRQRWHRRQRRRQRGRDRQRRQRRADLRRRLDHH